MCRKATIDMFLIPSRLNFETKVCSIVLPLADTDRQSRFSEHNLSLIYGFLFGQTG